MYLYIYIYIVQPYNEPYLMSTTGGVYKPQNTVEPPCEPRPEAVPGSTSCRIKP